MAEDAEDAAFLLQMIVVVGMRRQHRRFALRHWLP
jgi:hypothetical protein